MGEIDFFKWVENIKKPSESWKVINGCSLHNTLKDIRSAENDDPDCQKPNEPDFNTNQELPKFTVGIPWSIIQWTKPSNFVTVESPNKIPSREISNWNINWRNVNVSGKIDWRNINLWEVK